MPSGPFTHIRKNWIFFLCLYSISGIQIYHVSNTDFTIAYHVSVSRQFRVINKSTVRLMQTAYMDMRYLKHPKNFFIHYKLTGQQDQLYKLYATADSDLAGDQITRWSQTGWLVFYNDDPIVWKCCKQDVVSQDFHM